MKRGYRLASARASLALVLVFAWATAAGGCGTLLGIDDGIPYPADGSSDSTVGADSAADGTGADVASGGDTSTTPDTGSSGADVVAMDSAAMDAPGMDAPGVDAPPDVAPGSDSGDACVPEGTHAACGSNECNSVIDNCGNTVGCGVGGSTGCSSGQTCIVNAGVSTCCVQATCAGRCNTSILDNCGNRISCPTDDCPNGEVCDLTTTNCCVPDGTCGGPCVDNCGQQDNACCDSGMTMDAMPPPCTPNGVACGAGIAPCCSGICAPPPEAMFVPAGGSGGDGGATASSSGSGGGSGGSSSGSSGGMSGSSCGGPSSSSGSSSGIVMPPLDGGTLPPVCQP